MPKPTMNPERNARRAARCGAFLLAALLVAADSAPVGAAVLIENFAAVAQVPAFQSGPLSNCPQDAAFLARGWRVINNSTGAGGASPPTFCVTQGYEGYSPTLSFSAQDLSLRQFAGMSTRATQSSFAQSTSLWMITPRVEFGSGATLDFWTRGVPPNSMSASRDRLQVRVMTGPDDPDVGTGSSAVGQFTTVLLDINPAGTPFFDPCTNGMYVDPGVLTAYPGFNWCHIRLTSASGLPTQGSGYIAFRYYSPPVSTGPFPTIIGIDTLSYDPGVVPALAPTLAFGVPVGGTITSVGSALRGSTNELHLPVAIDTLGSGSGPDTITTFACDAPTAPFAGFAQQIVAQPGGVISANELNGTCVRGASEATQVLTCTMTEGTQPPSGVNFVLRCPVGISSQSFNRYADAVRADDPRLYWRLGETSGIAVNAATGPSSVGTTGDGTVSTGVLRSQAAVPQTGVPGEGSVGFPAGVGDVVYSGIFDKVPAGAAGLTLETWLSFEGPVTDYTNLVGDRPFVIGNSFAFLYLTPGQQLRLHILTGGGLSAVDSAGPQLEPGQPYHVVATWDATSGQMRIFVNGRGVPVLTTTGVNPTSGAAENAALNPIYIGTDQFEFDVGATIRLDETAVYSKVLSPERIQVHYDLGSMLGDGFEG